MKPGQANSLLNYIDLFDQLNELMVAFDQVEIGNQCAFNQLEFSEAVSRILYKKVSRRRLTTEKWRLDASQAGLWDSGKTRNAYWSHSMRWSMQKKPSRLLPNT